MGKNHLSIGQQKQIVFWVVLELKVLLIYIFIVKLSRGE
ncbi:hypothetical protein YpB42003004_0017 [Yersinia pestis biovar Antiqua str. B42003004]|uniref:Transposase n=1 Tax=Yersinia pestis biovar Orientalis str. IP275 TaxID=373665 RepID=A0AAV3BH14_YERPE|nr:hypothetical protein YpAngola_A1743 [Yersinia pestis Angola]EDR33065.1 hypothetical protein YPIP275_0842 [Yersinia pestis biovar Orientalis str. IP275]EDR44783.1 hypothetical protein YpE1979001_1699 [Yersinia pestis biovar Antiqua str. E1979001]EDR49458.1 hypothetical protein YpB42003004_0017 [Yersinia pestis biovar Antiqua str. B42003004]EEO89726.1 hypothetical protein YPS_3000 [Yersinia pestis Pestoides A]EFA49531.1 conserved hypothetical protein [Yersinia pestis KIM D27]EIQ88633.1 putat